MHRKGQIGGFNVAWLIALGFGVWMLILLGSQMSIPTGTAVIQLTNTSLYNNTYINTAGSTYGTLMTSTATNLSTTVATVFTIITISLFIFLYKMVV